MASSATRTTRANAVSAKGWVVRTSKYPFRFRVPPKTGSPGPRSTGRLSPVSAAWSTADAPRVTTPSTGIRSPGRTATIAPTGTASTRVGVSRPSALRTLAIVGIVASKASTERAVRDNVKPSIASPSMNRNKTVAASDQSPRAIAPVAAKATRMLMSSVRSRHIPRSPTGTTCQAPNAIERPNATVPNGLE